jgi:hypothetical protein
MGIIGPAKRMPRKQIMQTSHSAPATQKRRLARARDSFFIAPEEAPTPQERLVKATAVTNRAMIPETISTTSKRVSRRSLDKL